MATPPRLDERFGFVRANTTVLAAALLAAHAANASGYRATDVRFFGYLFANWLERDVLYPGEALDLTQVRRLLLRLLGLGWARKTAVRGADAKPVSRFALTAEGISALLTALVAAVDARSFEEAVFVVSFVASYRSELLKLLCEDTAPTWPSVLDPRRLVVRARRRIERVLDDLTARASSSEKVAREADALRRAGESEERIAQRLEALGVYQLQHIRAFSEFVLSFPAGLRSYELGPAFAHRAHILFETYADAARGQLRALDRLEARLLEAESGKSD
jgi:hypothetical protein